MTTRKYFQLEERIKADLDYYRGSVPETVVALWNGYLAAAYENDIISLEAYASLNELLPEFNKNLVVNLLIGVNNMNNPQIGEI